MHKFLANDHLPMPRGVCTLIAINTASVNFLTPIIDLNENRMPLRIERRGHTYAVHLTWSSRHLPWWRATMIAENVKQQWTKVGATW